MNTIEELKFLRARYIVSAMREDNGYSETITLVFDDGMKAIINSSSVGYDGETNLECYLEAQE